MALVDADLEHLRRCVELARIAVDNGHAPFGSILVGPDGDRVYEDYNRTGDGDDTEHPEFAIARWAAKNMAPAQRGRATVYTSCEHCPMCAAAHAWVGLGRIVYATSAGQLSGWMTEWQVPTPPVAPLPITTIAPGVPVDGPAPQFEDEMKALYEAAFTR